MDVKEEPRKKGRERILHLLAPLRDVLSTKFINSFDEIVEIYDAGK